MATQHPDNAMGSPFSGNRYISNAEEIDECYRCFSELGVGEYMWDWEGKFVDEAVIDRLYQNYHEYFTKNQLGRDKFLTFRIPNIWEETSHRLPRAFMNLISAEHAAKKYGFHSPPLFEVILPMTTRSDQLIYLQKKFREIADATEEIFDMKSDMKHIQVIPLFEEVETMADAFRILEEYIQFLQDEYHYKPEYMRVFIARSDPAMNAGLIPAIIALKNAVSAYHEFGRKHGIKIFPWVGGGSLPFRGAINPENALFAVQEYGGVASLTIQSAFRSDYPLKDVKDAIKLFNTQLPKNLTNYRQISPEESKILKEFNQKSQKYFQEIVEEIAPLINTVAGKLPSHRERVQHIGIFGYARGIGKVKLPRAIKFTGSLYSLGVPPELIGTGRALKLAKDMGIEKLIRELYINLQRDLSHAGHYLNRENLQKLSEKDSIWKTVEGGIDLIEDFIGESIGPTSPHHFIHRNFASNVLQKMEVEEDIAEDVLRAAEIRKSLG